MKDANGGLSMTGVTLIIVLVLVFKDSLFGAASLAQAGAVNSLNQGVTQNTQAVETMNTDIMGQLNSLVTGVDTINATQQAQGGLLEQVVGGLAGLATEVGGIRTDLQDTNARVGGLEAQMQMLQVNGGMVGNVAPTPVPLVTQ